MKIAVHVPVWGRHNILNKFFTYGDIPAQCDIFTITSTEEDYQLCKRFGANCINHPNQPLSIKLQYGLDFIKIWFACDYDAILFVGSDDILFGLDYYIKHLENHDFVALEDCYLRDNATKAT